MIQYKRTKVESTGNWKYQKYLGESRKSRFVTPSKVPPEIVAIFDKTGVETYDYDEQPDLPRCLFCEGYTQRQRYVKGVMIDLCASHYYSTNIGKIVAELNSRGESHGILLTDSKTRKQKGEPSPAESEDERQDATTVGAPS